MKKLLATLLLVSTAAYAFNGVLIRQYVEDGYRICVYQDGTEIRSKTQPESQPCDINY